MDKKDSLPAGMVRVPATETEVGRLGDFFIGRYEVTNREYKKFMDDGGYQKQRYWKYPFMKDDRKLTWEEALRVLVDQTGRPGPATWTGGDYPEGQGDYPVSGVSWYEAAAYSEWVGKSLPTSIHWDVARGGLTPMIQWPQLGGFGIFAPFTNFGGKGPVKVGSLPGVTAYGAYDMAGNVREWCWNETKDGRVIRGGSWQDNTYEFGNERQAPPMDRSPRNGFRLALYQDTGALPRAAFGLRTPDFGVDYRSKKPVSDAIFQEYREQFAYDQGELNPKVESRKENSEGWIHEIVSFNAAYGKERILAHLFLPSNSQPPFQTVIYFPGAASTWTPSSEGLENYYEFTMFLSYIVRNGRAVVYPIYKGTFERGGPNYLTIMPNTYAATELLVQEVKDLRRSIDYIQTRTDIDSKKIAYMGMSWGAELGAIIPAVEDRFTASVLLAGGLNGLGRPEACDVNYVSRVRTPTLMLNGKYDVLSPPETSSMPMFDLLGTPSENKRQIFYETDHIPPRVEYIKETLAWLDKYLGPVK
jgi:dienelactone hydrolase